MPAGRLSARLQSLDGNGCEPISPVSRQFSGVRRVQVGGNAATLAENPTDRPSLIHSGGSFLSITPPMCCLNIVSMVVSPRSSHSFGISMVRHDVVVVRELFMADCAFPVLLHNLQVQKLSHL
jgi:hypothetical protein